MGGRREKGNRYSLMKRVVYKSGCQVFKDVKIGLFRSLTNLV